MSDTMADENDEEHDPVVENPKQNRPGRVPVGFDDWPIEQRADWVARRHKRIRLLEMLLAHYGIDPEYSDESGGKDRLTKEELASIYIQSGGVI